MDYSVFPFLEHPLWQQALDLSVALHETAHLLPSEEAMLLGAQLRRVAEQIQISLAKALLHGDEQQQLNVGVDCCLQLTNYLFIAYRRQMLDYFEFQKVIKLVLAMANTLQKEMSEPVYFRGKV